MTRRNVSSMDNLVGFIMGRKHITQTFSHLNMAGRWNQLPETSMQIVFLQADICIFKANTCGLFVNLEHIYMAASPDAVVSCECCGDGLLKIKCPRKTAHSDPQSCSSAYLIRNDEG